MWQQSNGRCPFGYGCEPQYSYIVNVALFRLIVFILKVSVWFRWFVGLRYRFCKSRSSTRSVRDHKSKWNDRKWFCGWSTEKMKWPVNPKIFKPFHCFAGEALKKKDRLLSHWMYSIEQRMCEFKATADKHRYRNPVSRDLRSAILCKQCHSIILHWNVSHSQISRIYSTDKCIRVPAGWNQAAYGRCTEPISSSTIIRQCLRRIF